MQKKYRLKGARTFNYLYKRGLSCATTQLVLIYAPSKYSLRVGFVTSKKVGNAVIRNRARRQLREAFRSLIPYITDNSNYIIVARKDIVSCSFAKIKKSLINVLKRAQKITLPEDYRL